MGLQQRRRKRQKEEKYLKEKDTLTLSRRLSRFPVEFASNYLNDAHCHSVCLWIFSFFSKFQSVQWSSPAKGQLAGADVSPVCDCCEKPLRGDSAILISYKFNLPTLDFFNGNLASSWKVGKKKISISGHTLLCLIDFPANTLYTHKCLSSEDDINQVVALLFENRKRKTLHKRRLQKNYFK